VLIARHHNSNEVYRGMTGRQQRRRIKRNCKDANEVSLLEEYLNFEEIKFCDAKVNTRPIF
jgi:hypothetical protein